MDEIKQKLDKIIGLLEQVANPPIVIPTVWTFPEDQDPDRYYWYYTTNSDTEKPATSGG